jgi:hypothetical protein
MQAHIRHGPGKKAFAWKDKDWYSRWKARL